MKATRRSVFLSVLLMAAVILSAVLAGCGSADSAASEEYSYNGAAAAKEAGGAYEEFDAAEEAYVDVTAETETPMTAGTDAGALRVPTEAGEKLVYSGSVRLQTLEYDATMESIHKKITDAGGFVQWEDETDGNDYWYDGSRSRASSRYTDIQARIPSESFQSFMDHLGDDGQVMNRHVNVDNISQTYAETEASVKAYEIEQERLLEMMDKAETIEDMIAVEARLSEVEEQLGIYKTSLASMDRDVEYSTVQISVEEVREYEEEVDDSTFLSRLKETFKNSWRSFRVFLEGLLHAVIYLLPFLVLILVIFLIVRALNRKLGEKRRARRAQKAQQKMEKQQRKMQQKMQRQGHIFYGNGQPPMPNGNGQPPVQNMNGMPPVQDGAGTPPAPPAEKAQDTADRD